MAELKHFDEIIKNDDLSFTVRYMDDCWNFDDFNSLINWVYLQGFHSGKIDKVFEIKRALEI